MPRQTETVTVSYYDPELIERGKERARKLHMSFSGYVVSLIEKDLLAAPEEDSEAPLEKSTRKLKEHVKKRYPPPK